MATELWWIRNSTRTKSCQQIPYHQGWSKQLSHIYGSSIPHCRQGLRSLVQSQATKSHYGATTVLPPWQSLPGSKTDLPVRLKGDRDYWHPWQGGWSWGPHTAHGNCFLAGTTCDPAFWNLQKQQLLASLPQELLQAYGEDYVEEINQQFIQFMKVAVEDLSAVVNSITEGLLAANPAVRYYPGQGLGIMYFIHRYLPYFVRDLFLKGFFINPKLPRALRREHHNDVKKA